MSSSTRGRWWVLFVLTAIYASNYIDRQILAILITPLKAEFQVSDTALGLLAGAAFAIFYATLGVPIALIADRASRKAIIAISLTLWSGLTAACAAARSFTDLLWLRVGVGIGEAGGSPASISMISDLFEPERRSTAMAIYSLAVPLGGVVGLIVGGFVAEAYGWRAAFLAVGAPGLLLTVLFLLTVKEPARGIVEARHAQQAPRLAVSLSFLWSQRTYRYVVAGVTLSAICGSGVLVWLSTFFVRSHGLSLAHSGLILALVGGPMGALGTFLGGYISDRLQRRNAHAPLHVMATAALFSAPISVAVFLAPALWQSCAALALWTLIGSAYLGPALALCQTLAGLRMRALASAVLSLSLNLLGYTLGPSLTGFLSDALEPRFGAHSLSYALTITMTLSLLAAACYLAGRPTLESNIRRAAAA